MFYKEKLEKQVEEFKNKDNVKLRDVKGLKESIDRYNNKLKYVDKVLTIYILVGIVGVLDYLCLFVFKLDTNFIFFFTLLCLYSIVFQGILGEEGDFNLRLVQEKDINDYFNFNSAYTSDGKVYFMKDIMYDESKVNNFVNDGYSENCSYIDYILDNVIENNYTLCVLSDEDEEILYNEGKFLSYKEYEKLMCLLNNKYKIRIN